MTSPSPPAAETLTHGNIFKRYRLTISVTLILLLFENALEVLIPFLMGRAIDGLIGGSMAPLWQFTGVIFVLLAAGIGRRVYDTRAYGRIFREAAGRTVEREISKDAPTSRMTARVNFVHEFTQFFELMLPMGLTASITLLGAIIMLAIISPLLSALTVTTAVIVATIFFVCRERIERFNKGVNDEMERQVDVLETRKAGKINNHLAALVRWRIRLSDLEAATYGASYFVALSLLAGAIYVLIAVEEKSIGEAFAALTYVLQFTDAVVMLPYTYQEFIRTSEISGRLERDQT
ncbi:MAG: ABC transporter six-transmembrane domain-containing protein [Aquisalinus sp.]|nr:ABC transporter six-transmembrane domain-containing protein [Aquisalinus sp.]